MNSVKLFFTPIVYPSSYKKNWSETLLEKVDDYFHLGSKKAEVISSSSNVAKAVLIDSHPNYIMTALKVASYFLVVPLVVMLTAKVVLRSLYTFHLIANNTSGTTGHHTQQPLPHPYPPSYICPAKAKHFDAALPPTTDSSQVVGIYGNILYPQDEELELQKKLCIWIKQAHVTPYPIAFTLTPEEMKGISLYMIKGFPKKFARIYLAECLKEFSNEPSLKTCCKKAKEKAMRLIITFNSLLTNSLQPCERNTSHKQALSEALEECRDNLEQQIDHYIRYFQKGLKTPEARNKYLAREQFESVKPPFDWNTRLKVFRQMVDKTQASSPNSPYFLALQEVTPLALAGLEKTLADKNLQWISINNLSGQLTLDPKEEKVAGESTAFTTTIALSQDLEVVGVAEDDLPSASASPRKILGVTVRNKHSNKTFHLFTTHADHDVKKDPAIYAKTVAKIHAFITSFFQSNPSDQGTLVLGGDLNAFETPEYNPKDLPSNVPPPRGETYLQGLRDRLQVQDFRETDFYSPSQIAWSTHIGREGTPGCAKIDDNGILEKNALDHILVGPKVKLQSAGREALVYDDAGNLLDPHKDRKTYVQKLCQRQTFSDHLFNVVRFS